MGIIETNLKISDYTYNLPADRIALYPLDKRDQSKLLVYQSGEISHQHFGSLAKYLPQNSFLFFNDTKVIPARLHFQKETGASIEIFLLSPVQPSILMLEAMQAQTQCIWKCTIGNLKRWPQDKYLKKEIIGTTLEAKLVDRDEGLVEFRWNSDLTFAEIINLSGETPLPPYLNREAEISDRERYQTIYSQYEGAVAAPTAGLHFTDAVFQSLIQKGIDHDFLTLHVSAGTFQPVKTEKANDHVMHQEQIIVNRKNLKSLLHQDKFMVPVGTTSLRTLESLYWYGVKLLRNELAEFKINQDDPYWHNGKLPSRQEAIAAVVSLMDRNQKDILVGETSIYIMPGYTFKVCDALITNFHQPSSTLILLVAAFVGNDWKRIYDDALKNDYRFLSYGDSSLLIPKLS